MSQLKKAERQALLTALTAWRLPVTSHEGYKKAEVTGGGVPLEQVDCKTMESRVSVNVASWWLIERVVVMCT
jgi:predicted flavoprotein YhiN